MIRWALKCLLRSSINSGSTETLRRFVINTTRNGNEVISINSRDLDPCFMLEVSLLSKMEQGLSGTFCAFDHEVDVCPKDLQAIAKSDDFEGISIGEPEVSDLQTRVTTYDDDDDEDRFGINSS
jgi:hypothetical protein